jgi:hypothetical protein
MYSDGLNRREEAQNVQKEAPPNELGRIAGLRIGLGWDDVRL